MPLFKKLMSSIFSSKIFTTVTSLNIPRRILDIYKIGAVTFGVVSFGMMFRDLVRADVFHHHLHKKQGYVTIYDISLHFVFSCLFGITMGLIWPVMAAIILYPH